MRIGERYRNSYGFDDHAEELTPQDLIAGPAEMAPIDDEDEAVPTLRRGLEGGNATTAARSSNTLLPPPSRKSSDDPVDFSVLMREPVPISVRSPGLDFEATPMPTVANNAGSVAPMAMGSRELDDDDWIDQQLQQGIRSQPRWPYAIAAVAALGVGLVALSGWKPSWNQAASTLASGPQAPAAAAIAPAGVPMYRAEQFPIAKQSDDPEIVYAEIQQQLDQEARALARAKDQKEAREAREASRAPERGEPEASAPMADAVPVSATTPGEQPAPTAADTPAPEAATVQDEPAAETLPPFDRDAANLALTTAAGAASNCRNEGMPGGQVVRVSVTFAPSGRVNAAVVTQGELVGTTAGGCVARAFRSARVSPFSGPFITVHKTVQLQ